MSAEPATGLGHNIPPNAIDSARETFRDLTRWLADHPAIVDHAVAKEAKTWLDRTKATLGDLAAAEKAASGPLYTAWQDVIRKFKPAKQRLFSLREELEARIKPYLDEIERERREAAEAAKAAADAAALLADETARDALAASQGAADGEYTDVGAAIDQAQSADEAARRAAQAAAIAARDADNVRLSGGFGRSVSVRIRRMPIVIDHVAAIDAMGLTEGVRAAILTSARSYRTLKGMWPRGVEEIEERTL